MPREKNHKKMGNQRKILMMSHCSQKNEKKKKSERSKELLLEQIYPHTQLIYFKVKYEKGIQGNQLGMFECVCVNFYITILIIRTFFLIDFQKLCVMY